MRHILTYGFVFGIFSLLNGSATAELIKGYPDALVCEVGKDENSSNAVLYLQKVYTNGTAIYMSPNGKFGTLQNNGVFERKGLGCHGMSLDELRKKGKTRIFSN